MFAPYRVQKAVVRGALAHPANVVESAAMACVEPPDVTWRLTRARIAGDEVIELVLNGVAGNRQELTSYGFIEEIIHFKRRWFVLEEAAAPVPVLSNLLERRRPVRELRRADDPMG